MDDVRHSFMDSQCHDYLFAIDSKIAFDCTDLPNLNPERGPGLCLKRQAFILIL